LSEDGNSQIYYAEEGNSGDELLDQFPTHIGFIIEEPANDSNLNISKVVYRHGAFHRGAAYGDAGAYWYFDISELSNDGVELFSKKVIYSLDGEYVGIYQDHFPTK